MVVVELYGVPRLRAGASRAEVQAGSLEAVLRALVAALPGLSPDIVAIDGRDIVSDPQPPIADGTVLVVISAQAGG